MEVENDARVFILAVAVAAVVVGSFVPTGAAPRSVEEVHAASDALWHAATYAALTAVVLATTDTDRRLVAAAGVVALGAVVESGQGLVGYRTASVADAAANTAGVAVVLLVVYVRETRGA